MTTTAANKELVRRLYGGLMAKGDTAVAEEVLAEDYLDHDILGVGQGGRQELVGRAGRLVADQLGQRERARQAGLSDRPEPDRPRQARKHVPPAGRRPRHPLGRLPVGGHHP